MVLVESGKKAKLELSILGPNANESEFISLEKCSDDCFHVDGNGVKCILATRDRKVEFIFLESGILAYVKSSLGYPAYYAVQPTRIQKPVDAVLMDLDGTTVRSEDFWVWIIERSVASAIDNAKFGLEESDIPYVSGHSVSEHLQYCIRKYCPDKTLELVRDYYFEHSRRELSEIMQGRGRIDAFSPTTGLKDFLLGLKGKGIKIGLVTSGLYEKAWPAIISVFRRLKIEDPQTFYDAIITAGFPLRKGDVGTLGELSPKPHPWLYSECSRVGLGIAVEKRFHVVGIEDSGAGICSLKLAGFAPIGIAGGNIVESGDKGLCEHYCENFERIYDIIASH